MVAAASTSTPRGKSTTSNIDAASVVVTPLKSASSVHPLAMKLPSPRKVGDELQDADAAARHEMLQQMLTELIQDDSHVPALFAQLRRRVQAQQSADGLDLEMRFKSVGTFRSIDPEWLCHFVSSAGDMTVSQVVSARRFDSEVVAHLATFCTQLPLALKLPQQQCMVKSVMKWIVDDRNRICGQRLAGFKQRGGLRPDGSINWAAGCYTPVFGEAGMLEQIKHISGSVVEVGSTGIDRKYILVDNYGDFSAAFVLKPLPPVKCHIFWKASDGTGPYAAPQYTSSAKSWKTYCEGHYAAWEQARQLAAEGSKRSAEVQQELGNMETQKRQAQASQARVRAQQVLSAKRQRRSIQLEQPRA